MTATSRRVSDRVALAISLLPGTAFMLLFVWRAGADPAGGRRFTLFDDAMVSMTYGRTLAKTGEFVWYPGAPRVEGITNPLWSLYMSVLHLVGLEGSSAALAVSLTGVLLILAASVLVFVLVRRALGSAPETRPFWLAAAASTPFLYPLTFWTLRGMEVGLLAVLLLVMVWAAPLAATGETSSRARWAAFAAAAVLGVLTRLDFALLAFVVLAWCMRWAVDRRERLRIGLFLAAPMGLALAAILLFQRLYWGDWLPNTYRLKVEGFSAQTRVHRGLVTYGKVLPLLVLVVLALVVFGSAARRGIAWRLCVVLTSLVVAASAYSIWVGGDAWEQYSFANRYVSVILPAAVVVVVVGVQRIFRHAALPTIGWRLAALLLVSLAAASAGFFSNPYQFDYHFASTTVLVTLSAVAALVFALSSEGLRSRRTPRGAIVIAVLAVGAVLGATSAWPLYSWASDGETSISEDQQMTEAGLALRAATQDGAVVAVVRAGAPAYSSSRVMIDLLGKSDPVIAKEQPHGDLYPGHNKWDYDYSIGTLRPDVVLQLWKSPPSADRFAEWGYVQRCLNIPDDGVFPAEFLAGSPRVNWHTLHDCPAEPQ